MSRQIRRVPSGFGWPLNKVWEGFRQPEFLGMDECSACWSGYSDEAERYHRLWYGSWTFRPEDNGSTPYTPETPHVREFAEQQIARTPEYYGTGEAAIVREATRIAKLYNGCLSYHLNDEDVTALYDSGAMERLTHRYNRETKEWEDVSEGIRLSAEQINILQSNMLTEPVGIWSFLKMKAEREGFNTSCWVCKGSGQSEKWKGQRKAAKKWKPTPPPKGKAWQLWETVSEGSPVSPAFDTPEELASWLVAKNGGSYDKTLEFVAGEGWAPSGIIANGEVKTSEELIGS